jgi:hypothetical protein
MTDLEKAKFLDDMSQASKLFELAQAALQRARSQTEGELNERMDVIAKRAFELKVKADWLRYTVLGKVESGPNDRQGTDRRVGVDRRIVGMQKRMLSVA